jgi:hypothetical protein
MGAFLYKPCSRINLDELGDKTHDRDEIGLVFSRYMQKIFTMDSIKICILGTSMSNYSNSLKLSTTSVKSKQDYTIELKILIFFSQFKSSSLLY